MRAAVGSELDRRVTFPITRSDIRRWAVAIYHPDLPPRRFWDEEAAVALPLGGIVAPEDFNPFAWMVADPAGPPRALRDPEEVLGIEGPPLTHRIRGAMSVEYGVHMRPDDVITSVRRLNGYDERDGRLGAMLFTSIDDTWMNQREEFVKRFEFTFIRY
jgi:hypothetical protein